MIRAHEQSLATAHTAGRRFGGMGWGGGLQAERLLASSISAKAPWRRSRCSWRRRLAAPPAWLPLSSSSSSDWRNSMGSCCSWSSALALPCGFTLVEVGARCSRVCQYLLEKVVSHLVRGKWHPTLLMDIDLFLTLPATLPQPCCPQTGPSPGPPLVPPSSDGRRGVWDSGGWHVWTDSRMLWRIPPEEVRKIEQPQPHFWCELEMMIRRSFLLSLGCWFFT